jgi:hypothetical protein
MILLIGLVQAIWDWLGWFVWLHEPNWDKTKPFWKRYSNKWAYFFRIVKFILDFPITLIALYILHIPIDIIVAFYIAKWFHLCDSFYNLFSWLCGSRPAYYGEWRWFTPLGLYRTIKSGIKTGCYLWETVYQTILGIILAYLIIRFEFITWLINLI